MTTAQLKMESIPGRFAICRLESDADVPDWVESAQEFTSITRTDHELSIVAPESSVPEDIKCESGWVAMRVVGTLDFSMIGVLAQLTTALAYAGVSVFVVSTHDTDYLFVKEEYIARARQALSAVADVSAL